MVEDSPLLGSGFWNLCGLSGGGMFPSPCEAVVIARTITDHLDVQLVPAVRVGALGSLQAIAVLSNVRFGSSDNTTVLPADPSRRDQPVLLARSL